MRIKTWIKTIGIICIVFGAIGLVNGLLEALFMPNMMANYPGETSPLPADSLQWLVRMGYLKVVVNAVYLLAGIFFLLKKSFSVRFMYAALGLSLLYGIVPMLLLRKYSVAPFMDFSLNPSNFLGPLIDVLLLVAVYRISGNYMNPPDETRNRPGSRLLTPRFLKIWTLAAVLCLLVPLSIFGLWSYVSGLDMPRVEKVAHFKGFFPGFLQGQWATSYLSVVFSVFTIIFSGLGLGLEGVWWRVLNIVLLIAGILFLLWNLFSLM